MNKETKTVLFGGFAASALIIGGMAAIIAMKTPEPGNFLIEQNRWTRDYQTEVYRGKRFNLLDKAHEIYGREQLIAIVDQTPKDRNGILIQDLDLTIALETGDGIVNFITKKGDIVYDHNLNANIVGINYVKKDAASVLTKVFATVDSETLLSDKSNFETSYKDALQTELDLLYGANSFKVNDVKIASFKAGAATEAKIQNLSAIRAENTKNQELIKALEGKKDYMLKNAEIIKEVSNKTGLSVDQILQSELIKVISENGNAVETKVQVDATPKRTPKP